MHTTPIMSTLHDARGEIQFESIGFTAFHYHLNYMHLQILDFT